MQVLVVEDDAVLADGLRRVLGEQGMQVEWLADGSQADLRLQRADTLAVAVLDIGVPGVDGFELVRRLRARGSALPVLLLTARDAIADRVRGLELGADDYLVKPFASAELVARLRALVRRNARGGLLTLGQLTLEVDTKRVKVGEQQVDLSAREWAVLEFLLQHAGKVVSKQQIIDAILPWGDELSVNAVEVYVSRVRLKIADGGVSLRTIRGFGYMLEAQSGSP